MPKSDYPMNTTFRPRYLVIGTALLICALSASALTLGRMRGAALIGRPLDVVIQVAIDTGDDSATVCPEADVFQGDFRIDGSRVTTEVVPGASPKELGVRVRTSAVIEEPVVTVYLRAGCATKNTRRYVLLADIPSEIAAPRIVMQAPGAAPLPAPAPAATAARVAAPAVQANGNAAAVAVTSAPNAVGTASAPASASRVQATPPVRAAAPKAVNQPKAERPAKRSKPEKAPQVAAQSRLKLEPLDLTIEHDPVLRASSELLSAPTNDENQRRQAAALWRAVNAQPEEMLQERQRLDTLQKEYESLKRLVAARDVALVEVRTQLKLAEESRYANVLVYSLAGLLVLLAALAAYLAYRWRKASEGERDWWRSPDNFKGVAEERDWGNAPVAEPMAPTVPKLHDAGVTTELDLGLGDSNRTPLNPTAGHSEFFTSLPASARAVNVEELFDIQQQADFFMTLGQHDQAIELLRNHISENAETSALAYLDLLSIYHSTQRRDDYSRLRGDFNKVFNAQVPEFDAFADTGSGLEAYENAMARVEALWPSAKVLEIIEESIFRKPGQNGGEAFDLEAYRELLLLYAMAKDIVDYGDSGAGDSSRGDSSFRPSFSMTSIHPLSTSVKPVGGATLAAPSLSTSFGLDLDLTESEVTPSAVTDVELDAAFTALGFNDPMPELSPEPEIAPLSNLIDFDLFDEATARDTVPKKP